MASSITLKPTAVARTLGVVAGLVLLLAGACSQPAGERARYRMARDPGSRHDFRYVQDTESGLWVIRDCELRVSEARELPEPLQDEAHGSKLSVSIFRPGSVASGLLLSIDFERRDGYRVWRGAQVLGEDDLAGRVAYGVQVEWPQEGKETRYEPLEVIELPPLGDAPPDQWSPFLRAGRVREGAFGWWEEAHGEDAPEPAPREHPFEVRCRLVLKEVPGVVP
jgi:hypothetical protein